MINVLDLDYKTLNRNRKVNGERVIQFTVFPTEENIQYFDLIVEEAIVTFKNDEYVIKKLEEKSKGKKYYKEVTAVHKFYVDLINKQQPKIHNGSITFYNYMQMVFENTGYTFEVIDQFSARQFENLGNDNRLALLQKGLDRFKAEFELVDNNKKARIRKMIGNDTDFQFRYGHNIKAIDVSIDTTNLATKIAGTGDPELNIKASYESPNVAIFGEIDAPPVNDERFKSMETLLEEMKSRLIDEPEVSITVDFVDLRAAGYPYAIPNEGDRIWLIYEPMDDLLIETRILEINEVFDKNEKLLRTEVTLSNHRKSFAGTMFDNIQKQLDGIVTDDGLIRYSVLDEAVRIATESLESAQTELEFNNGIIAREKGDPNRLVLLNSKGIGISKDGGNSFTEAITADGFVLTAGAIGRLSANNIQIGPETFYSDARNIDYNHEYVIDGNVSKDQNDMVAQRLYVTDLTTDDIEVGDELRLEFNLYTSKTLTMILGTEFLGNSTAQTLYETTVNANNDLTAITRNFVVENIPEPGSSVQRNKKIIIGIKNFEDFQGDVFPDGFIMQNVSLKITKVNNPSGEIPFNEWLDGEIYENATGLIEVADGVLREDLRLNSPLPTSLRLDVNGITAYTSDTSKYARLDHRGLYIRGGAIQIDGGLPDGQIGSASKWNRQGTYIDSNGIYTGSLTANQVQIGFNNVSNYIKLTYLGLETYDGLYMTSLIDESGHRFYRDEKSIGHIGTSNWVDDTSYRGLRFGLENDADYMTWAFKKYPADGHFTTMLSWHKTDAKSKKGFTFSDDVHVDNGYAVYLNDIRINGYATGNNRQITFSPYTWNGYSGVVMRRASDGAKLFLAKSRAALINEGNAYVEVGTDGTDNYVKSIDIRNRTSTLTTNMVRVTNSGILQTSSSSRRYKLIEEEIPLEYAKRILNVNAKSWHDKIACENYAHTLTTGEETEPELITRIGGVIAEDVHDVGLEMYVNYDDENKPDGIAQYLWTLLIPITKEHEQILKAYDERFGTLEGRIDKMEKEIELLKGA